MVSPSPHVYAIPLPRVALACPFAAPDKVVPHHAGLLEADIEGCPLVVDPLGREKGGEAGVAAFFEDDFVAFDFADFDGEEVGIGATAGNVADFEGADGGRGGSHLVALM